MTDQLKNKMKLNCIQYQIPQINQDKMKKMQNK